MSSEPHGARRSGWLAWPLLALSALPVVAVVLVAHRVLTGRSRIYGQAPVDQPFRERADLLLSVVAAEQQLLVPLLALAGLAWLARRDGAHRPPGPALWAGAGTALAVGLLALAQCGILAYLLQADPPAEEGGGLFARRSTLLEVFGPRAASALLLGVLALALAAGLAAVARRGAAAGGELVDEGSDPGPEPIESVPEVVGQSPAVEHNPAVEQSPAVEPSPAAGDPHARYRRPF